MSTFVRNFTFKKDREYQDFFTNSRMTPRYFTRGERHLSARIMIEDDQFLYWATSICHPHDNHQEQSLDNQLQQRLLCARQIPSGRVTIEEYPPNGRAGRYFRYPFFFGFCDLARMNEDAPRFIRLLVRHCYPIDDASRKDFVQSSSEEE